MKMSILEKQFVNSRSHSRQVSQHAERLLKQTQFKSGHKYLDVGCGNGAAAIHLAESYQLNVTGIDVDPAQIQLAKTSSQGAANVRFLTIDGGQLPFEDGEFDIVFTNKVTHHIPNWEDAITEMMRVLNPGGYLIYSDLIFPGWLAAIARRLARNLAGYPTAEELDAIFEQHNLTIIRVDKSAIHYEAILQNGR